MTTPQRISLGERNVEQAIVALKRGSYLLKYGRRGKPKFCPFRLSNDETTLVWYAGKEEKHLVLSRVTRIIPGQRTAIFQRYPQPEKEYQSFSLIYGRRSLDVICKDKDEAEAWFVGLKALISQSNFQTWRSENKNERTSSDSSSAVTHRNSQSLGPTSSTDVLNEDQRKHQIIPFPIESPPQKKLGRALSDFLTHTETVTSSPLRDAVTNTLSSKSYSNFEDLNDRSSADTSRISFASAISSSSHGSFLGDLESSCDVFIWGEGISGGLLGGGVHNVGNSSGTRIDAYFPKSIACSLVLDAKKISCGKRHAALVTPQGGVFTWGEGTGGKLGHGVEADISNPKVIESLNDTLIESVACGEYHTCAVSLSGDLYTWGDGVNNRGLLGHGYYGYELNYSVPKKVKFFTEGVRVTYVSCGPWHTAVITTAGELFTFGDGTFGALGHGSHESSTVPREVEALKGLKTVTVSCGFWHTAAVVEDNNNSSRKLFTWGSGDRGQLGHLDKETKLVPCCVTSLNETNLVQVACGHSLTVCLTSTGQVYTMGNIGNSNHGPTRVLGKIKNSFIEEIACGSHHIAVLSSKSEVYTWGKGENGQLGHGDNHDLDSPKLVEALKDKKVKSIVCGNNFTASICLHKQVSTADHSICSGCKSPFCFRLKRHNCYNCGLVFCNTCSSKKSLKASLAPIMNKPYRVCDDCFNKLNKDLDSKPPKGCNSNSNIPRNSCETKERVSLEGILSRLSSFDSFRRSDSRLLKKSRGQTIGQTNGQSSNRNSQSDYDYSLSVPGSTLNSRTGSPIPNRSVSFTSAYAAFGYHEDESTQNQNQNHSSIALTKEISLLREQVEVLTRRSRYLEGELERTSRQLKEATDLNIDEVEKNNAAKEVIKSLMMQMKDMAVRAPPGSSVCRTSDTFVDNGNSTVSISST